MVKNTTGGSKTKGQARKHVSSSSYKSVLRLSESPLEIYAIITKIFGNGRCQVTTTDGHALQCIIRNKFKGRTKKFNIVGNGSIILAGLREWEGPENYKTCDLLEVYDMEDVNRLRTIPSANINALDKYNTSYTESKSSDDVEFTNEFVSSFAETKEDMKISAVEEEKDDDLIDIDDI
jgi:translation initiation factor IF-1